MPTNLFVLFELDHHNNNWEWAVRGIAESLDSAVGLAAQCKLICADDYDFSNWIIEEVPINVPLRLAHKREQDRSWWIVAGAVAKYLANGEDMGTEPND